MEEQEQCSDWLQMRGVPIAFTSQKTSPEKREFSLNMCHLFFKHYMLKNKYCWKEHQLDRNTMNHLFQDGFMEGWINHDKPMISWDDLPTAIDYRPSSSTQGHRRRLGPGHGTPMGVVAWWDLDQLFLTNLRSTHWLTPSFSTKVGISPTSKHVFSFFIYI